MTFTRLAVLLLCAASVFAAQQPFQSLWKFWGHGVNARTPFSPSKSTAWSSNLQTKMTCTFGSWGIPFDSLTSYGPFAIHPIDGRVFVGVICNSMPYVWIINNAGGAGTLVQLSTTSCSAQFNYASGPFEGYFNFLPDGSLVFGMCGSLAIYNTTTGTISTQSTSIPPVVLGVANTDPPQLLWAGGWRHSWWTDWGMSAVNFTHVNNISLANSFTVSDSTLMWGVNGTRLYNGHFNQWAPNGPYGLQYWSVPLSTSTQPDTVIPECGNTRPWTFASDNDGSVYSSLCSGSALSKYDASGNSLWNITSFENNMQAVTLFLSDDERYVYAGDTRAFMYVVDAMTGDVVHKFNVSQSAKTVCDTTVYGPFAARWPVPLPGNHKFLSVCSSTSSKTSFVVMDPANPKSSKVFSSTVGFSVISVFVDAMSNVYAIGIKGKNVHVERWTASTL